MKYVGKTDRELKNRIEEHKRSWEGTTHSVASSSAFSTHRGCTPGFANARILGREPNAQLRLLVESAFIRTVGGREEMLVSPNDAEINRNSGTHLYDRWLPLIRQDCERALQCLPAPTGQTL